MRLTDTDKLYKKLSPKQAATMAFEANVRRDDREMDAIIDCQPQLYFVGASNAFRSRTMGLVNLSLYFGSIRWKSRALMIQAAYSYNEVGVTKALKQLGSMELALSETCHHLSVDVASVRKLAGCAGDDTFIEFAESETTAEYVDIFKKLAH